MSIQASWNSMLGSAAQVVASTQIANAIKGKKPTKPDVPDYANMSPEELANARTQATNPKMDEAINGMESRLTSRYGLSPEAARQLTDDIRAGRGEGWTSRFDEARAMAQRAREAAQEADERPVNNITTAEEALRHLEELKNQTQGGNN